MPGQVPHSAFSMRDLFRFTRNDWILMDISLEVTRDPSAAETGLEQYAVRQHELSA